ncbi:MAG: N-acetylmuramoyl-L-alanine amidase [Leptospiraceae bacterium]|nr:N-acetylmuramoyl-L-alanine amidase [Leptospiraceae bacterium]
MGKIQKFIWTLSLCLSPIFSEEEVNILHGRYIDFDDLNKKIGVLTYKLETPTMHGSIKGNTNEILRFQIDSPYYYHRSLVNRISKPIKYTKGRLLLPVDFVESVLILLVENEVSFRVQEDKFYFTVLGFFNAEPEPIDLAGVILDPGHGGTHPGTLSVYGDEDKHYNLEVAKLLAILLKKKFPNLRIIMTREEDESVDLNERYKLANQGLSISKNIIFVSLHCNASPTRAEIARGYEIFYLDQSYKIEQEREKTIITKRLIDLKAIPEVQRIESGMFSSSVQRRSILLANSIEEKFGETIAYKIPSRGVKKAKFRVLRGSIMPAVLVEMGFLTNPEDAKLLADKSFQMKIAQGILEGIKHYVNQRE